jgi:ATP-binding cassette subfamily B protein
MAAGAMAPQRAKDFRGTARRILARLLQDRATVAWIAALGVVGTALSVVGPRILGHATDLVFSGYLSSRFPAGATQAEVVEQLRASGQDRLADVVLGADVQPGQGIDFTQLGWVLVGAIALYVLASGFMWWQGRLTTAVVQRMVGGLRHEARPRSTGSRCRTSTPPSAAS